MNFSLRSVTGFCVGFRSEDLDEKVETYRYAIEAMLPGVVLEDWSDNNDIQVIFEESSDRKLLRETNILTIKDIWNGKISLDLWHLMYSIFREDLIAHELYSVHAACLGKEKSVLLLGHTGTGKTTAMIKLLNDYEWQVFSGNRTIIDFAKGVNAIGGTKTVSIRSADLEKYPKLRQTSLSYSDRATLTLDDKYFQEKTNVKISAICIIKIEPGADRMVEMTYPSTLHALFPYFLDTVYADTLMCDGNDVYSGRVTDEAKKTLALNLKDRLGEIKVVSIAGSDDFLSNQIKKLI